MRKALIFVAVFSQPLIGIPLGIVLGTHAAYACAPATPIVICIEREFDKWIDMLSSLI